MSSETDLAFVFNTIAGVDNLSSSRQRLAGSIRICCSGEGFVEALEADQNGKLQAFTELYNPNSNTENFMVETMVIIVIIVSSP
jgi:hypothetical protein